MRGWEFSLEIEKDSKKNDNESKCFESVSFQTREAHFPAI